MRSDYRVLELILWQMDVITVEEADFIAEVCLCLVHGKRNAKEVLDYFEFLGRDGAVDEHKKYRSYAKELKQIIGGRIILDECPY